MPRLVFIDDKFAGCHYELVLEKTTVGRTDENTLTICDSSISSTHCEILLHGSEVIVRDLDSKNGTFVNDLRLNKQAQLKAGQRVRFGAVEARLELEPPTARDDGTEITAVYELSKIQRDQRRKQKQPPPDPSARLEPALPFPTEDHTVLIPRRAQSPEVMQPAPSPSPAPAPPPENKKLWPLLVAALALISIVVLWLVWGRR
jgi:predicted component of type VI protein secretion system